MAFPSALSRAAPGARAALGGQLLGHVPCRATRVSVGAVRPPLPRRSLPPRGLRATRGPGAGVARAQQQSGGGDGEQPSPDKEPKESKGAPEEPSSSPPQAAPGTPPPPGDSTPTDSSKALEVLRQSTVQLPRSVVETLRDQVFGFDTFFVTGQEPYQGGVLFQGNLRGDPAKAYTKINAKLKEKLGDGYLLYLLNSPQEEGRPVAVVVPRESIQPPPPSIPDSVGAAAFGVVTVLTILLTSSPTPDLGFIPSLEYLSGPLLEGIPATGVFLLGLLAHEAGHLLVARKYGLDLALPYFIPSYQLGSLGAITRIKSVVANRSQLVEVAAAGPLLGSLVSLAAVLLSLLLLHPDAAAGEGTLLDASAFQDSLLVGILAKLALGDALREGVQVAVSPVTIAAWSCLLANAINAIPAGELDGARVVMGLFGRQTANRLFFISLVLLGITGIFNDIALFWVVLIYFLQRGPIPPQADELSPPSDQAKLIGAATLVLCFLVYCPLPFQF